VRIFFEQQANENFQGVFRGDFRGLFESRDMIQNFREMVKNEAPVFHYFGNNKSQKDAQDGSVMLNGAKRTHALGHR
jgi:hypothetical protein